MDRTKKRQIRISVKRDAGLQGKRIIQYTAGLSGLVLLITAAFLIPQFIFRVQDDILCGNTELGQRMHLDVEAMRTDYEKELPIRLENFVNGLKAGDVFYVTSREMEINQEIQEYLYSDAGLYQGIIDNFIAIGLIDIWGRDFTINQWKRYVIYSDNYAKGVNFILWYIELQDSEEVLKLLVDGEDGTIYALKTEVGVHLGKGNYDYWAQMKSYLGEYMFFELWGYFAEYYDLMTEEVAETYYSWLEEIEKGRMETDTQTELSAVDIADTQTDGEEFIVEIKEGKTESEKEELDVENGKEEGWNVEEWYAMEGENRLLLTIPCGESTLDVVWEMENPEYGYSMPNVTMGIRDIYERIPEF